MKKIIIPLAILIASTGNFYAQQQASDGNINIPNIIPPSPTAYALGNYGNVPVGLFTGTAELSVPLFTYKTDNIDLLINMSYGSNGLKIDEISSITGLGWNLNFGGVITRTVRDRTDDSSQTFQIPANAFQPNNTPAYQDFIYNLGNLSPGIDTEADIYSFNFNGISGKFFYDRSNQIHLIDQQALKIEEYTDGFIITTSTGEKYYFSEKELTIFKTLGVGKQLPNGGNTAWYLTKIVHPKGDEVYFTYEDMYLDYKTSQSQNYTLEMPHETCLGTVIPTTIGVPGIVAENFMTVHGKRIKTIISNNPLNGSINFTYSTDTTNIDTDGNFKIQTITQKDINGAVLESASLSYLNTTNKRNFLTGIVFKDPNKSYAFQYNNPSEFPVRLSLKRDYWGYYNGKANISLLPKVTEYNLDKFITQPADQNPDPNFSGIGMLTKITYPTKGYTELEYEGNTYWGPKTVIPPYSYMHMEAVNGSLGIVNQSYSYTSPFNQTVEISGESGFNISCVDSGQTHNPIGRVQILDAANNVISNTQFINNQTNTVQFDATAGVNYTIKLSASRCTYIYTDAKYLPTAPQTFDTNVDTGGVRIKTTKDYDSPSAAPLYKRYYYGSSVDINHSSGDKGTDPYFVYTYKSGEICDVLGGMICVINAKNFVTLTSNSLLPLFDTDKNTSTFYRYVTISRGGENFEGGGEAKEFIINRDYAGSQLWGSNNIWSTPYSNYGWNNGLEVSSSTFLKKANGTLSMIQRTENNYEKNDASTFEFKNFTHRKNDLTQCTNTTPYVCTQYDTTYPGHACYGQAVGYIIDLPYIDNLDVVEYRTISSWKYLQSQSKTDYLNGQPILTKTEYFYDNPLNYQLSREKTILADATVNEKLYQYAHEKGNQLMINKNMIGIPFQTEVKKDGAVISKTETIYPTSIPTAQAGNLVLPTSVLSYNLQNLTTGSIELKYDKYDALGHLQQYTTKDGISTSIIWGYNNTKPIAKIDGAKLSDISQSLIDLIVSASDLDASAILNNDETALLSALNTFATDSNLSNYQVTTYTYDPLVGVRSITPPSGIREMYIYDTNNRLKEVREQNQTGKLLKEYQYNYKN